MSFMFYEMPFRAIHTEHPSLIYVSVRGRGRDPGDGKFPDLATEVELVATLPVSALAELGPVSPSSSSSSKPTRSTRPASFSSLPPRAPTATGDESVLLPLERPR